MNTQKGEGVFILCLQHAVSASRWVRRFSRPSCGQPGPPRGQGAPTGRRCRGTVRTRGDPAAHQALPCGLCRHRKKPWDDREPRRLKRSSGAQGGAGRVRSPPCPPRPTRSPRRGGPGPGGAAAGAEAAPLRRPRSASAPCRPPRAAASGGSDTRESRRRAAPPRPIPRRTAPHRTATRPAAGPASGAPHGGTADPRAQSRPRAGQHRRRLLPRPPPTRRGGVSA